MSAPAGRLVLATRNAHKVEELRRILAGAGLEFELLSLDAFPDAPEVAETGATFAENALLKAHAIAAHTGLPAIADDSGLAVDALNGMPGVLSARWAGPGHDDRANLELLLSQVSDVPEERRGAQFVCAAVLARPDGAERVVEGVLSGSVTTAPRGSNGFGYDPVFVPEGESRTTAELTAAEKDAISHRGIAFRALAAELPRLLAA
ncbi:XTP/dITP diphosphatase [Allonocardiopsis opalescens]|uniref:dITP/XTP pyrophosphatase n=1 Tax=Allonocardiopsis opalescens TaxID=1144618 RepID=A0A2T0Q944_9ACTN|nr:XTP/dITP diphosphatase [Allonocardiopsis opalescens]PRY00373.1 XTP/dITP diphosphohydrolase [Allonocardiopsis opalescens]